MFGLVLVKVNQYYLYFNTKSVAWQVASLENNSALFTRQ